MFMVRLMAVLAASTLATAAWGQSTPGEIADPGSYRGSMALQAQEQADAARQQQQNEAMLNRLDQTYSAYAPGRTRAGAAPPLRQKPLLPVSQNPLLGLWRMGPTKAAHLGPALGAMPGAGSVDDAFAAGCAVFFADPNEVIRFTPTAVNKVRSDGREELVEQVEYRGDHGNVIVLPLGTLVPVPLIVGLSGHDNAVVALFGCTMSRTKSAASVAAPRVAGASTGKAVLTLTVGEVVDGRLSAPPAGTQLFLSTLNPDANLVRAGFAPDPVQTLFAACKISQGGNQQRCSEGLQALKTGAIGVMTTDPNGHAMTGGLAPGRYYIVGYTPYRGHALVWHLPVDLKPGPNDLNLTPQLGSLSH